MTLEEQIAELRREVTFLAQMMWLLGMGHATVSEHERLAELREREPRCFEQKPQ